MGEYMCVCGKKYKQRQSLHTHKKTCKGKEQVVPQEDSSISTSLASSDLVIRLLQETKEMRDAMTQQNQFIQNQSELHQQQMREQQEQHNKQIQELIPKIQATTINNTNTNSNNTTNKFNLNFFLNEQCKDAISIQTFIRDLNIGIKELEHMGNVGYLQGMISIMSNTLGAMDIYKRPVHCTDLKREAIYIKDGDTWKKDNANNDDLKRVIDRVADKNYRNLALWEADHPEAFESDTPDNIEYCKIALESLGGGDTTDEKALSKLKKIVKHVVREVYVR
jgi:DNA-binding transcriptional MerR regulator